MTVEKNLDKSLKSDEEIGQTPNKKIVFSVPSDMIDEFSEEAARNFGFKKGSKSKMFINMWNYWKSKSK